MKTMATLVTLLALLCLPAAARAKPVSCRTAATLAAFPGLRIVARHFHDHDGARGYLEYACTSTDARPLSVGLSSGAAGVFQTDTLRYDFAGGRYLAAGDRTDQVGDFRTVTVWDLRTRRTLFGAAPIFGDAVGNPVIRLSTGGVAIDAGVAPVTVAPGGLPRRLSRGRAEDVAVAGSTLYWTQSGTVHAETLPGPGGDAPDSFVDLRSRGLFPGPCRARIANDIARDGFLRVAHGASGWFACSLFSRSALRLPADLDPGSVRIAARRWVYFTAAGLGHVVDVRRGAEVGTVALTAGAQPLLLDDGRVAWIDATGTLMAQRPGAPAVALATGAGALAAAGKVVYWMSGGVPHRR